MTDYVTVAPHSLTGEIRNQTLNDSVGCWFQVVEDPGEKRTNIVLPYWMAVNHFGSFLGSYPIRNILFPVKKLLAEVVAAKKEVA